jgi:predicted nucleotidyltransferase
MRAASKTFQEQVETLIATGRETLRALDLPSVQAAILYGSALGQGWRLDSDVDIAILDSADARLSWREQAKLMDMLERATGRSVDLRMLRDLSVSHQAHVLETGRLLWAREAQRGALEGYRREVLAAAQAQRAEFDESWPQLLGRLTRHAASKT